MTTAQTNDILEILEIFLESAEVRATVSMAILCGSLPPTITIL